MLAGIELSGCGRKAQVSVPKASPPSATASHPAPTPSPPSPPPVVRPETPPAPAPIPATPESPPPPPTPGAGGPSIRIGLTTNAAEVRISASELVLVEKRPEAPRLELRGEYRVRVEQDADAGAPVYRVQVAALSSAASAEDLARRLRVSLRVPAVLHPNPSSGAVQVRAGEFSSRDEAQRFASGAVADAGYPGAFVVEETAAGARSGLQISLRGQDRLFRINRTGFLLFPLDLTLNRNGRITVVNQLGLEEYLWGVVPAEIPPSTYPEPAALAAQAVAARTFALKNLGRFKDEGFDLTADERTQVYGGAALENAATNRAVDQTRGLALYYEGNPIEAMYSSTCGGRTEDFANVFDKPPVPYLVSVACAFESGGSAPAAVLRGSHGLDAPFRSSDGSLANRNLELAEVLGLTGGGRVTPAALEEPPTADEARAFVARARALARSAPTPSAVDDAEITTRAGFLRHAAESLFGRAEIAARVSAADADYHLANLKDGPEVPEGARRALGYLIERRLWLPQPDNSAAPRAPVRRGDALHWLARWLESTPADALRSGVLDRVEGSSLVVKWGNRTSELPLAANLRLFRVDGERRTAVSTLQVIGSEKLSFHVPPDGRIDFLEVELNPSGAHSDRFSPQATWRTTLARRVVAEKLRALAPGIGELRDLVPARLGASGRAVAIRAEGSRQSVVLNGYRVRAALGLRDTLFTISRSRNPDGSIEGFTFDGRGWGHGVGLCQLGAVGMARAGRSFEEILKTYYRGVELRKVY
ncbi:MAG: hypothetical protein DMG07_26640 [Acidobacteria bacterium]|nr:MAG: hypothetical protein DMG07_26640 [Acidobacteriota bacterium]